jgi:hypothetical protein
LIVKEEKSQQEEDTLCPEYFENGSKKILPRLQCRFADGELERLGIVNLSQGGSNSSQVTE